MSDEEASDELSEMPSCDPFRTAEIQEMLLWEKQLNLTRFASHWEMDEEDIDEASEEEKQNNPAVRILWAAETGNLDVVTEMLNTDASLIAAVDADGYTPLHRASYEGHCQVVELLLDRGAAVNAKTADGWTALHSATYWGQAEVMTKLISRGADVNSRTAGSQTPLHLAASAPNGGNPKALQILLLNEFVDVNAVNKVGETARTIAQRSSKYRQMFEIAADNVNILCAAQTSM